MLGRSIVSALVVAVVASCSSGDDGASSSGGASATPALRKDVIPILERWCATSACHGTTANNLGVFLPVGDPDTVHAELLKDSPTASGTKLVVPGDPAKSFFFAKVEGSQADFEGRCVLAGCGETMPPGTRLAPKERDAIRAWIQAGAKND